MVVCYFIKSRERGDRDFEYCNGIYSLPADSFSIYKIKVISNEVCLMRLYTIKSLEKSLNAKNKIPSLEVLKTF